MAEMYGTSGISKCGFDICVLAVLQNMKDEEAELRELQVGCSNNVKEDDTTLHVQRVLLVTCTIASHYW